MFERALRGALIPGEQIADFERWRFANVNGEPADAPRAIEPLDQLALDAARQLGFEEGVESGARRRWRRVRVRWTTMWRRKGVLQPSVSLRCSMRRKTGSRKPSNRSPAARWRLHARLRAACCGTRSPPNPNTLEPVCARGTGDAARRRQERARVRLSQTDFDMLEAPLSAEFSSRSVTGGRRCRSTAWRTCLIESAGAGGRWRRRVALGPCSGQPGPVAAVVDARDRPRWNGTRPCHRLTSTETTCRRRPPIPWGRFMEDALARTRFDAGLELRGTLTRLAGPGAGSDRRARVGRLPVSGAQRRTASGADEVVGFANDRPF